MQFGIVRRSICVWDMERLEQPEKLYAFLVKSNLEVEDRRCSLYEMSEARLR